MDAQRHGVACLQLRALLAVAFATFIVALGYGAILPLLPTTISQLMANPNVADVARHTSLLTGVFAIAPLVAARPWGILSDRYGRVPILIIGLVGFGLTFGVTDFQYNLLLLYFARFVNGCFAAAIVPSVLAFVTDREPDDGRRSRAFGLIGAVSSAGLLAGPVLGGLAADWSSYEMGSGALSYWSLLPFGTVTVRALGAAVAVGAVRRSEPAPLLAASQVRSSSVRSYSLALLALSAATAGGLGLFEVSLTLRSEVLFIPPSMLGLMFAGCMVVMLLVQVVVFSPLFKPAATRWFIAPAFMVLGVGLVLIPFSSEGTGLVWATSAVAASGGLLGPVLAYWLAGTSRRGAAARLGLQSAVASVGQALGSVAAGLIFANLGVSAAVLGALAVSAAVTGGVLAIRLEPQEQKTHRHQR